MKMINPIDIHYTFDKKSKLFINKDFENIKFKTIRYNLPISNLFTITNYMRSLNIEHQNVFLIKNNIIMFNICFVGIEHEVSYDKYLIKWFMYKEQIKDVVLIHNHPVGSYVNFSYEDFKAYNNTKTFIINFNGNLIDYLVIAENQPMRSITYIIDQFKSIKENINETP